MNFLESLVAEWYEYTGYFVRTNLRTRKRPKGGWDVELDVLAFAPGDQRLIHIETSGDANSWSKRKNRFLKKKFILSHQEYGKLIGFKVRKVERIAVVGWAKSTKVDLNWGGNIRFVLIPTLMDAKSLNPKALAPPRQAVPLSWPTCQSRPMHPPGGLAAPDAAMKPWLRKVGDNDGVARQASYSSSRRAISSASPRPGKPLRTRHFACVQTWMGERTRVASFCWTPTASSPASMRSPP